MEKQDFLTGLCCGISSTAIIGFLLARIQLERIKAGAEHRPMAVLTSKTPADVRQASRQAAVTVFGLTILVIVVILALAGAIYLFLNL